MCVFLRLNIINITYVVVVVAPKVSAVGRYLVDAQNNGSRLRNASEIPCVCGSVYLELFFWPFVELLHHLRGRHQVCTLHLPHLPFCMACNIMTSRTSSSAVRCIRAANCMSLQCTQTSLTLITLDYTVHMTENSHLAAVVVVLLIVGFVVDVTGTAVFLTAPLEVTSRRALPNRSPLSRRR